MFATFFPTKICHCRTFITIPSVTTLPCRMDYSANFNFENGLDPDTSLVSAPLCWLTACF